MRIVIIGGGAAGALTAIALLRLARRNDVITIVEPKSLLGAGVAFGSQDPGHLLNVPALGMSAYESHPEHFAEHLAANDAGGPFTYASRSSYAAYLNLTLQSCARSSRAKLEHVPAIATDIDAGTDHGPMRVILNTGSEIATDYVVLCLGLGTPRCLGSSRPSRQANPLDSNWSELVSDMGESRRLAVVIGTGLSAADAVGSLARHGARNIIAISPRGRFPAAQAVEPQWPRTDASAAAMLQARSASEVIRLARRAVDAAGPDWRPAIDGLRSVLPTLWSALDPAVQDRLVRHVLPVWEAYRHRVPPSTFETLTALRESGVLRVVSGRAQPGPDGSLLVSCSRQVITMRPAIVVPCMGWNRAAATIGGGLTATLLRHGSVQLDGGALRTNGGRVTGPNGGRVWVTGMLSSDLPWENFAVSTLRRQADQIAEDIRATRVTDGHR